MKTRTTQYAAHTHKTDNLDQLTIQSLVMVLFFVDILLPHQRFGPSARCLLCAFFQFIVKYERKLQAYLIKKCWNYPMRNSSACIKAAISYNIQTYPQHNTSTNAVFAMFPECNIMLMFLYANEPRCNFFPPEEAFFIQPIT